MAPSKDLMYNMTLNLLLSRKALKVHKYVLLWVQDEGPESGVHKGHHYLYKLAIRYYWFDCKFLKQSGSRIK